MDEKKNISQFSTIGFNPYFMDEAAIAAEIKAKLLPDLPSSIKQPVVSLPNHQPSTIYFYGAGCSSPEKRRVLQGALSECFPEAKIHVDHDLLAAARALCGKEEGIAAILGTGSNSCYYNGSEIKENYAALGFILGDEGSGAHMGKLFIQDWLNKETPAGIAERFVAEFKLSKEEVLDAVYKKPLPNRFLASFSTFIFKNLKEPYMSALVTGSLRAFFDKHICKYPRHKEVKLNCTGSVAFYYHSQLKAVAEEKGVQLGKVLESPIAALTLYHIGE